MDERWAKVSALGGPRGDEPIITAGPDMPHDFRGRPSSDTQRGLLRRIYELEEELAGYREAEQDGRLVMRGKWIIISNGRDGHECSKCRSYAPSYQSGTEYKSPYCPNCGAKMCEEAKAALKRQAEQNE